MASEWRGLSPMQRWAAKVILPDSPDGCWLWTAAVCRKGYGIFALNGGRTSGHRFAYERFVGPIPEGREIDHRCRVRHCVNPDHLEAVTHRENIRRSIPATKTQCAFGHPLSGDNLIQAESARPHRRCRQCALRRQREWKARARNLRQHRRSDDD